MTNDTKRHAALLLSASVLLGSLFPLAYSLGGSQNAPLLFVAVSKFICCAVCIIYLLTCNYSAVIKFFSDRNPHDVVNNNGGLGSTYKHKILLNGSIWLATIGSLGSVFFPVSLNYIDVSVATILAETWSIFMVILTARLFSDRTEVGKKKTIKKVTSSMWFLFFIGFIGIAFVVLSQNENIYNISDTYNALLGGNIAIGVIAVLLMSIGSGAVAPYTLKWGVEMSSSNADSHIFVVLALFIVMLFSGIISLFLGLVAGERFGDILISVAIIWGLIDAGATITLRLAHVKTDNLGLNALFYTTPIFALIWLALASQINVPHVDLLVIGTLAIITANLLINAKADIRLAYRALMISLWASGAVVYLGEKHDYTGNVEVAATIFILILAFRVDRLVRRTSEEENNLLLLFRRTVLFAKEEKITPAAPELLLRMDTHTTRTELKEAYDELKRQLGTDKYKAEKSEMKDLADIEAGIDAFAHSKQQGMNFGEIIAIGFVGGVFVIALLFFNAPGLSSSDHFFTDISSFILAAVTLFLFFNIIDLEHDRVSPVLHRPENSQTYQIVFDDATSRTMQQWISVIASVSIIIAYAGLFWGKWL